MKECLDKSGLQYFYEKLCKIFLRKDQQAVFVLTSQGIEEALGYTPVSNRLYSTDIEDIKKHIIQFNNDLKNVTSVTNSTGIAIDTLKAEIAQWADQIDTVNGEVTSVTRILSAQSGKIQDIASKYYQLGDRLTVAENTIDVSAGHIKSVISQVQENRESIVQIKQWMDENQIGFDISAEIKNGTDQAKAEILGMVFEDPNDPTKLNSRIKVSADDIQIDGQNINLSGNVTFKGLEGKVDDLNSKLFGETTITGGLIKTELINTNELKVKHLDGATGSFSGSLTASDISASTINGGTITGQINGTGSITTTGTFTGDIVARSITLGNGGTAYNSWDSLKSDINISDQQIENVISSKFDQNVITVNKLASAINNLSYSDLTTISNGVTAALSNYATTSNLTQLRTDLTNLLSGKVDSSQINGIVDEIVQNRTSELVIPTITKDQDGVLHISVSGNEYKAYEQTTSDGKYVVYGTNGSTDTENGTYFILGKDGLLKANNAIIHGVIVATSGHFTGEVTAKSGKIGGWLIGPQTVGDVQYNCLYSDYDHHPEDSFLGEIGSIKLVPGRGLYLTADNSNGRIRNIYDNRLLNTGLIINRQDLSEWGSTTYGAQITCEKFEMSQRGLSSNSVETSIISARFNSDGSGLLANGGISWDTNGSVVMNTSGMTDGLKVISSEQIGAENNYTIINGDYMLLNSGEGSSYLNPGTLEIQGTDATIEHTQITGSSIHIGSTDINTKIQPEHINFYHVNDNNGHVYDVYTDDTGEFYIDRTEITNGILSNRNTCMQLYGNSGALSNGTISWNDSEFALLDNKIRIHNNQENPTISFYGSTYTSLYYTRNSSSNRDFVMQNGSSSVCLTDFSNNKSKVRIYAGTNTGITIDETTNSITSTSNISTASDINMLFLKIRVLLLTILQMLHSSTILIRMMNLRMYKSVRVHNIGKQYVQTL